VPTHRSPSGDIIFIFGTSACSAPLNLVVRHTTTLEPMQESVSTKAFEAFREACVAPPSLNLRAGYTLDSYQEPPPYDATLDDATDSYLEQYTFWGLTHLDAGSWRHYLPRLIQYAILHPHDPHMVVEGLLHSLRPPDREPPRLGSLSPEQEAVVVAFLESVATDAGSPNAAFALQVLEEWWVPEALYRPPGPPRA
jgi:hypothetical protein